MDRGACQATVHGVARISQTKLTDFYSLSLLYGPDLTSAHDYWKTIAFTRQTFVGQVMSLLFNILSRFVITLLPRSKHLCFIAKLRVRCRDGYPAPHMRRFFPP